MVKQKGEWYPIDTRDVDKPRQIDGKWFHRSKICTTKSDAEKDAASWKKHGYNVRIITRQVWGKLFGYPDSIPHKKQCYVVYKHHGK